MIVRKGVFSTVLHNSVKPILGDQIPVIEIAGEKRVLIENHSGIIQYSGDEIRVKVKFGCVCILGDNLQLAQMTKEKIVIIGTIIGTRILKKEER